MFYFYHYINASAPLLPLATRPANHKKALFHSTAVFTSRRYASAVYAVIVYPYVCLSARLSQVALLRRWTSYHANNVIR